MNVMTWPTDINARLCDLVGMMLQEIEWSSEGGFTRGADARACIVDV